MAVHLAGLLSLAWIVGWYLSGTLAIPDRYIILRAGTLGLVFLVASFACTPIRRLSGWPKVVQLRRPLGLYGFLFVGIHFGVYLFFENGLDVALIWRDLGERRAMSIGVVAFLLLMPLAVTSTLGWQRRLGRRWRQLHWLVYPSILLSIWHYLWLDRDFKRTPLIYAVVVLLLLLFRLPFFRSNIQNRPRSRRTL